jgi:hypothetical protein
MALRAVGDLTLPIPSSSCASSLFNLFLWGFWLFYSFPRAAITKCHKLSGLEEQEFILSHFWKPEVQSQGKGMFPFRELRKELSLSLDIW